ncbi:MAG: TPM domain-containing protein [Bacteroidia bacterium]|nr:TPM domain-containing protein [Bacteroidia bacterium]
MFKRLLFIVFFPFYVLAQNFPYPAIPTNYVTDEAQILESDEETRLNAILKNFEDSTSIQLFVYTSPALNGFVMADVCQEIFHKWRIGHKKTNNGVLIGIFVNDHAFRIHTGYGMEGVLPDLLTKRIQDKYMRPYFKQNDYYTGISAGIDQIHYFSKHEYTAELEKIPGNWESILYGYLFNILMFSTFLYFLLRKKQEKKRSQTVKTVLLIVSFVLLLIPCIGSVLLGFMLVFLIKVKGSSGSYTSSGDSTWFSSSSSDSSYDSGSSFDGGGGGDSGGGGSDSSW